jgi:aminoglycoside 6'-N-acetyltransferase I
MHTEDIRLCAELFTAVYTAPPWQNDSVTIEKAERYIGDMTHAPGFLGYTYYIDDKMAGMVLGTISDYFFEPQYKIEELAVYAAYRRQNVGTKMLQAAEADLRTRGVAFITLQTGSNIPAYPFYLKNEYMLVEENVYMVKSL